RGDSKAARPLQRPLPHLDEERNGWVFGQTTVLLRLVFVVQHINHVRAADAGRIVNAGILVRAVGFELLRALVGQVQHVCLAAKVQAARGAGLDASRFKPRAYAIRAERAFVDFLGFGVEFGDIEWAAGHAILAADAVFLIEVDNAIGVLHDGAVRRTGHQAARLFAVHALVFAHEPLHAIVGLNFIELDQVPEVPRRFRHGLVGVVKSGFAEVGSVPLQAGNLAGLAADAGSGIHQLAHVVVVGNAGLCRTVSLAIFPTAGSAAAVSGDRFYFQCSIAHGVSP